MSGARVDQLSVAVGEDVKAGQVVTILDTYRSRAATLRQSRAMIAVAKSKLAQIKTGPKLEDVKAQEAAIRRSEADLVAAQSAFERTRRLIASNAISREEYDSQHSKYEQSRASLEEAKAKLESMKAIRSVGGAWCQTWFLVSP